MRTAVGLPLTMKELTEQSARKRTYVLRVLVGAALALAAAMTVFEAQRYHQQLVGQGMRIFELIAILIVWLPVVFAPALAAGCIAGEREDGSLPLLQMTRLGPMTIVLEKWLSRLVVVVALQLIAVPLLALAYACGGVSDGIIWWTLLGAIIAGAHATALAVLASAWCRGTVGALFLGYGFLLACYLGSLLIQSRAPEPWLHANAPAIAVTWLLERRGWGPDLSGPAQATLLGALVPTGFAVLLAVIVLRTRRHREGGNRLLALFRRLDAFFDKHERGVLGRRTRRELPLDRPVAWRETSRRSLVNPRYLARILVPLGAVVVFGMVLGFGLSYDDGIGIAAWTGLLVEVALTMCVLVLGATAFSAERSAQSLEVLLTTPLTPRDILLQKVSGLRRVHLGGTILVGLVLAVRWLVNADALHTWSGNWSVWLALLSLALQPVVMAWLGLVVGLHIRSRTRAVGTAVGLAVAWSVGGGLLVALVDSVFGIRNEEAWIAAVSPSILGMANHHRAFRSSHHDEMAIAYALSMLGCIGLLRTYALWRVGTLLRRT